MLARDVLVEAPMNVQNFPAPFSLGAAARNGSSGSALYARSVTSWLQKPDLDYPQNCIPRLWSFLPTAFAERANPCLFSRMVALVNPQPENAQEDSPALRSRPPGCWREQDDSLPTGSELQARASQQLAHPANNPPQGKKNFLAENLKPVPEAAMQKTTSGSQPDRQPLRLLAIGSRQAVIQTVHTLFLLGFAEVGEWSPLLPGPNPGEVMSILTRSMPTD